MTSASRRWLAALAAVGLAASGAATWVHAQLIANPDYASFCDVNTIVSCKRAYLSAYGSIGGVPVALGGVFFFALILILVWGAGRSEALRETAASYVLVLSTLAMALVLYLAYASFFVLREVCPLCVTTYVAVAGIWIVALRSSRVPVSMVPRRALRDAGTLFASTSASVVVVLFGAAVVAAVLAFPTPQQRPVVGLQTLPADQRAELEGWFDLQPKMEVPYPASGAKVLIVKFNDFQCPACRATYFAYEPVLAKYANRPQDVTFLLKHFPLDSRCNSALTSTTHPASCDAAAAVVMARATGRSEKVTDWLYLHQNELTESVVRGAAADIGGISDFDVRRPAALDEVRAEAAQGAKLGVDKTPTFFINGRKIDAGLSTAAFDAVVDMELKRPRQP